MSFLLIVSYNFIKINGDIYDNLYTKREIKTRFK